MAYGEKQVIPIKPITLIFGPNDSGKTSIIKAFTLLKSLDGSSTYSLPLSYIYNKDLSKNIGMAIVFIKGSLALHNISLKFISKPSNDYNTCFFALADKLPIYDNKFILSLCESILFIGPVRPYTKDDLVDPRITDHAPLNKTDSKKGLLRFIPKPYRLLYNDSTLRNQVSAKFQSVGILYKLRRIPLSKWNWYQDMIPLPFEFVNTFTGLALYSNEIGFGISQILLILIEALQSTNRIILCQQPEAQLHPSHQSGLGDIFIESARKNGNTFIIETHSEHLLFRIMRAIRETYQGKRGKKGQKPALTPDDVSIVFVEKGDQGSRTRSISLGKDGTLLDPWPDDFFELALKEFS